MSQKSWTLGLGTFQCATGTVSKNKLAASVYERIKLHHIY
jgi:hypothetical protein